jgi:hypothetical protein
MRTILILASNPKETSVLRLNREVDDIREGLRRSLNREQFILETRGAVRPEDLRRAILDVKPQIVHFCGHGTGKQGLVLENDDGTAFLASTEALSDLFKIFADQVECVLLNACYSEAQADAIVQHINYVIGMNREVRDDAAIAFALSFYEGLGGGLSVEKAFALSRNTVQLESSKLSVANRKLLPVNEGSTFNNTLDYLIPVLKKKPGLAACEDPDFYIGTIWTQIIPEPNNVNKQHLITIRWGNYRWQQVRTLAANGLLLCYEKRNQDYIPRVVIVSCLDPQNYPNTATSISSATQVRNGQAPEPSNQEAREQLYYHDWHEIKW